MRPTLIRSLTLPHAYCKHKNGGDPTTTDDTTLSTPDITSIFRKYLGTAKRRHSFVAQPTTSTNRTSSSKSKTASERTNSLTNEMTGLSIGSAQPSAPSSTPSRTKDIITLVVDQNSEGLFDLPMHVLSSRSAFFKRFFQSAAFRRGRTSEGHARKTRVTLPKVDLCDFFDFVRWLESGRILQISHSNVIYAVEQSARRLINAIRLGLGLESELYQQAAMRELYDLGHVLTNPENLVNEIFATTSTAPTHPLRRLIVAIVAVRTGGHVGQNRSESASKQDQRQYEIKGTAFWVMYDEYCRRKKNDFHYPGSFEDSIA